MTVIDLGAVRATRAAELEVALDNSDKARAAVTNLAEYYAALAFSISGPFRLDYEQVAVDINRSQWRRVLTSVRAVSRHGKPEVRAALLRIASLAFSAKLEDLIRADDARRGLPRRYRVVGGLFVTAHQRQWTPTPWPTVADLGGLGTLVWMTHVEHTPYYMRPATRVKFDAARKELQAGVTWLGAEPERMLNRIFRVCWERGWRPDEARSA